MTLAELIKKLQGLTSVPDSAIVYIQADEVTVQADVVQVNNHGESITIW